jgi:hypothetical protein
MLMTKYLYSFHYQYSLVNKQSSVVQRNEPPPQPPRPKLVFHCQQAHGSPTGIISGFTNVKELYQKIADCYDMPVSEVNYITFSKNLSVN